MKLISPNKKPRHLKTARLCTIVPEFVVFRRIIVTLRKVIRYPIDKLINRVFRCNNEYTRVLLMFLAAVKTWKLFKFFAVKELWDSFPHPLTKFLPHWDSPAFLLRRFTIRWPWTAENPIKVLSGFNVYVMTFATPVRQFCADCSWKWLRLLHCTSWSSC